jgi:hypothetical protein
VCLSADGRFALSGSHDNTLRLWELASGRCLRTFEGHKHHVNSVCLSADGRFALSGGKDNTLRLWELASGRCLRTFEGHKHHVNSVCLSADGRFALSGSVDETLRLWELARETTFLCPPRFCLPRASEKLLELSARARQLLQQARSAADEASYRQALSHVRELRASPGHERTAEALDAWEGVGRHCRRIGLRGC